MPTPVLELLVYGHPYVFSRNERGEYEYVFNTLRIVLYPEGHTWSSTLTLWSSNPSDTWRVTGHGKNAQSALVDVLQLTQPRIQTLESHVLDFRDFLRGA